MKPDNILLVAAGALLDSDGRVLLAKRPVGKSLAGKWEFPGGKVEAGETSCLLMLVKAVCNLLLFLQFLILIFIF